MIALITRRLLQMLLIAVTLSAVIFIIFDSDNFRRQQAVSELGGFGVANLSQAEYENWLASKQLDVPAWQRYLNWIIDIAQGDFGRSLEKDQPIAELVTERLKASAILGLGVFLLIIPLSIIGGVLAGIKVGSVRDRSISLFAVITTSIPEIATAIFLTVIFALWLKVLPGKAVMFDGFEIKRIVLPVLTLVLYDTGYLIRITRSSIIGVMNSNYIRTARLKGISNLRLILHHVLRNALITPFTILVLQLNWLLSGVVIVEVFFQYNGFGKLLLEAALYGDIYVIQIATLIAVIIAVCSQLISDVGYILLNPQIRFKAL